MKTNNLGRHGDLNFRKVEKLPKDLKEKKDNVLALGEHTGHKHVITVDRPETSMDLFEAEDGRVYMSILGGTATLKHEEHHPITFEEGVYEMKFEREYDYFMEEVKQVID